jgi:hypothetical protein
MHGSAHHLIIDWLEVLLIEGRLEAEKAKEIWAMS